MMYFKDLPQELVECIAEKCSKGDLLNLACCCKDYSNILKPMLWQFIGIDLNNLVEKETHVLECMQYTTRLRICNQTNEERCDASINTGLILLAKIFNHCDPMKLKGLIFDRVGELTMRHVLGTFKFVESLYIQSEVTPGVFDQLLDLGQLVDNLPELKDVTLYCGIPTEQITKILEKPKLHTLALLVQGNGNEMLPHIIEKSELRKLSLLSTVPFIPLDVRPLEAMSNLTELILYGFYNGESFKYLCQCENMQKLKSLGLDITHSLNNASLSKIHRLSSLTRLFLKSYSRTKVTAECFEYISRMRSLRYLQFHESICAVEPFAEKVALLNKMSSLETVIVMTPGSFRTLSGTMHRIVSYLVKEKSWNLKYDEKGSFCTLLSK